MPPVISSKYQQIIKAGSLVKNKPFTGKNCLSGTTKPKLATIGNTL